MNTIKIQSRNLTFDGSASTAMDFVDDVRNAYDEAGNDMPKLLNDFIFSIEVALQNAGILDEYFNKINQ
jgi:hypothetical protein